MLEGRKGSVISEVEGSVDEVWGGESGGCDGVW